jgi:molybdopterin-containing oxidoreductase family membrane subunit
MLGGFYGALYWLGHIVIGTLVVVWLGLFGVPTVRRVVYASVAAIIGSVLLLYSIVVGSQVVPQRLFPGKTVIASTFGDSGLAQYVPSVWEFGLGIGGVALALLLLLLAMRVLPLQPEGLES